MNSRDSFSWDSNPGAVQRLAELWANPSHSAAGCARIIGQEYGVQLSRSSVMGKVHRLGLKRASNVPHAEGEAVPTPAPSRPSGRVELARRHLVVADEYDAMPDPADPVPELAPRRGGPLPVRILATDAPAEGYGLLDLPACGCRFPVSSFETRDHRFCGARALTGKPYCEAHQAVAYDAASTAALRGKKLRAYA